MEMANTHRDAFYLCHYIYTNDVQGLHNFLKYANYADISSIILVRDLRR